MGHHIHLRRDSVGAPDHDAIGLRHFTRINAGELACARHKTAPRRVDANGLVKAGVFFGMAQTVDAVAHDAAHGSGVIIRPNAFSAVLGLGFQHGTSNSVERFIPRNARKFA